MEQLKRAYEAIEMLKALDLPVSNEQLEGIAKLEKQYLQEEIIPLLKQELEPKVNRLKGKFQMEVTYDVEKGFSMNLLENIERRTSSYTTDSELSTRDTTKYSIDGGLPLKKRRFVLAVVKQYVDTHPGITYNVLRLRFPDELSGSPLHGVIRPYNEVMEKINNQPDLSKRFFLNEDDLITLSDGTILTVYNQWGESFSKFLKVAEELHEVKSHATID